MNGVFLFFLLLLSEFFFGLLVVVLPFFLRLFLLASVVGIVLVVGAIGERLRAFEESFFV